MRISTIIEQTINEGLLEPGCQLPPQRELADALGVTLGTVTRGYQEAKRKGMLVGETGRGTFVRTQEEFTLHGRHNHPPKQPSTIPFDLNFPVDEGMPDLPKVLLELGSEDPIAPLLQYQKAAGLPHHREVALSWLQSHALTTTADRVFLTAGGQHSIHTVLLAQNTNSGPLAVEEFTYPGIIHSARMLGRPLVTIPMDQEGMIPEELASACSRHRITAIYLMPAIQNPTGITMPVQRREKIAEIAEKFDLTIIEDDVYGPLQQYRSPPLQTLVPDRTFYFTSLSKSVAPGLRIGFLVVPPGYDKHIETALSATVWMIPPLIAEIGCRWIQSGEAHRCTLRKQRAAIRRQKLAASLLPGTEYTSTPGSLHLWLCLPEPWRAEEFTMMAQKQGVAIMPSITFTPSRQVTVEAVRICFGAPSSDTLVEKGFGILAQILKTGTGLSEIVI